MALTIKNVATERLARELAGISGESLQAAIHMAIDERLQRLRQRRSAVGLRDQLLAIGAHCAALPDLDRRTADEIIGYDARGLS